MKDRTLEFSAVVDGWRITTTRKPEVATVGTSFTKCSKEEYRQLLAAEAQLTRLSDCNITISTSFKLDSAFFVTVASTSGLFADPTLEIEHIT